MRVLKTMGVILIACHLAFAVAEPPSAPERSTISNAQADTFDERKFELQILEGVVRNKTRHITLLMEVAPEEESFSLEQILRRYASETLDFLKIRKQKKRLRETFEGLTLSGLGVTFRLKAVKKEGMSTEEMARLLRSLEKDPSFAKLSSDEQDEFTLKVGDQSVKGSHLEKITRQLENQGKQELPHAPNSNDQTGNVIWNAVRAVDAASTAWDVCHIASSLITGDYGSAGIHAGLLAAGSGARAGLMDFAWPWVRSKCPFVDRWTHKTRFYFTIKGQHQSLAASSIHAFTHNPELDSLIFVIDGRYAGQLSNHFEKQYGFRRLPIEASLQREFKKED